MELFLSIWENIKISRCAKINPSKIIFVEMGHTSKLIYDIYRCLQFFLLFGVVALHFLTKNQQQPD